MAKLTMFQNKKGIVFTLIILLMMLSFLSLFSLLQIQDKVENRTDLQIVELTKMQTVLNDISSSYLDVLGITLLSYTGNSTEQTFTLNGNVQIRSHTTLFESFLDEYETGRVVDKGGMSVSHVASTNDYIFYPYDSYLTVETSKFIYGGGDISSVESIELNITIDELYASVSDTFVNDGSGTSVTVRILDNASATYTIIHTLDPTQANQNAVFTFDNGETLTIEYDSGTYGDGTLEITEDTLRDVNITGFSVTHSDALTSASGFYTNTSITFDGINTGFSGKTPLLRG